MQSGEREDTIVSKHRTDAAAERAAAKVRRWSPTAVYIVTRWEA
jgi:hypothetical protein